MANKLDQWLSDRGIKRSAFAEAIGVTPSYVTLLCSAEPSWPGRDVAARIRDYTGGAVTADDFLPPATVEAARRGIELTADEFLPVEQPAESAA